MNNNLDLKQRIIQQQQYPLTWLVIALCTLSFLLLSTQGLKAIDLWFMPPQLTLENSWQLITPSFIHYTFLHFATNLIIWWMFATKVEPNSTRYFLLFFTISAAFSNICQWLMTGSEFGGLSGVNYALLGYLLVGEKLAGIKVYKLDPILTGLLLLLIPLGFSGKIGQLANYAHIGGLLIGCLLAVINLFIFKKKI